MYIKARVKVILQCIWSNSMFMITVVIYTNYIRYLTTYRL